VIRPDLKRHIGATALQRVPHAAVFRILSKRQPDPEPSIRLVTTVLHDNTGVNQTLEFALLPNDGRRAAIAGFYYISESDAEIAGSNGHVKTARIDAAPYATLAALPMIFPTTPAHASPVVEGDLEDTRQGGQILSTRSTLTLAGKYRSDNITQQQSLRLTDITPIIRDIRNMNEQVTEAALYLA
jgi:hypothetical protein